MIDARLAGQAHPAHRWRGQVRAVRRTSGDAWASTGAAAVAGVAVFTGVFVDRAPLPGMGPGRVSWGQPAPPVSFAAAGGAMVTVITAAARQARWQGDSPGGALMRWRR